MEKLKIKNRTSQTTPLTTQKGITLVALVITIIVLLILAGVAINMAINSEGLFAKAGEATQKWNESVKQEEIIISELLGATEAYKDGVNAPRLGTNMIPVYYDNGWKKADNENEDNNWYEYDTSNKKWANAVTVTASSRSKYLSASKGIAIAEEDILGMFVWIPRYAYRITEGYHPAETTATPLEGAVEIKFLKGTTDEYEEGRAIRSNATNGENYVVHPAFTNDTVNGGSKKETTGFWVAKFEASSNTTTADNPNTGDKYGHTNNETSGENVVDQVTIRPNVTSWRYISAPEIYQVCKNMNAEGNIHGLTSLVNPHMMKNSEWGAVAYLTQSVYGNKQTNADDTSGVWNNNYHNGDGYGTTMTGAVGASRDAETQTGLTTTSYSTYNEENGVKGSTTGTIYGIYDMAGGAWEYVAGYLASGTNEYVTFFKNLPVYEKQEYLGNGSSSANDQKANFQANYLKYGDAIWEIAKDDAGSMWTNADVNPYNLSWFSDYSSFPLVTAPFFRRGGNFVNGEAAGVFAFVHAVGERTGDVSFRPVIGV